MYILLIYYVLFVCLVCGSDCWLFFYLWILLLICWRLLVVVVWIFVVFVVCAVLVWVYYLGVFVCDCFSLLLYWLMFWVFLGWFVCDCCGSWCTLGYVVSLVICVLLDCCLVLTVGFVQTLFCWCVVVWYLLFYCSLLVVVICIGMSVGIALLIVLPSSFTCCFLILLDLDCFALLIICCLCWIWIDAMLILVWWFRFGLNCFVARWLFILLRLDSVLGLTYCYSYCVDCFMLFDCKGFANSVATRCFYYLVYFVCLWLIVLLVAFVDLGFDLFANYCRLVIVTVFAVCFVWFWVCLILWFSFCGCLLAWWIWVGIVVCVGYFGLVWFLIAGRLRLLWCCDILYCCLFD